MRQGDWMQVHTGRQFWPMDPRADEVDIVDIAHALAMSCRYGGHCEKFYSVAEHSVLISRHLAPEFKLWGLLHDASEAYASDIIRPLKPHLSNYHAIEARLMAVICEKFGLTGDMPIEVKRADNAILGDEKAQVMGPAPGDWHLTEPPLGVRIEGWPPLVAKSKFLHQFYRLSL